MQGISVKGTAGVLGGAVAYLIWTLLAVFVDAVKDLPAETLLGITGATGVVLGVAFFYWIPESARQPEISGLPTETLADAIGEPLSPELPADSQP